MSDESPGIQRFFLRKRTLVHSNRDDDKRAIEADDADATTTTSTLLSPRSQLEIFKWSWRETFGFTLAWAATLGVIAFLLVLLPIGS